MQTLEALTRDARALANGEVVLSAPETEVARQGFKRLHVVLSFL